MELNVIYNKDCLEGIKELPDNSVDAVITDPPFFLGVTHNGQKGEYSDLIIMKPFFSGLFFEINRVLKNTGKAYICTDWRTYPFLYPVLSEYLPIKNLLVWYKGDSGGNQYMNSHEFVIFCSKGGEINIGDENTIKIPGFAAGAKRTNGQKLHPTQKPVELFEKFILDSTNKDDTVLDCFMGSGTLAIAAIKTKRNYIGFEIQEKYCKIAQCRINKFTGDFHSKIENFNNEINLFT
ncbi:MAG: site-specific DNA-methyltransferase [Candidatus Azobacteroides sp.]|nr:site-specific DNA-methyltransferase [Candidatus Azobacteroides sp.]